MAALSCHRNGNNTTQKLSNTGNFSSMLVELQAKIK
jgi:hypothetical protein